MEKRPSLKLTALRDCNGGFLVKQGQPKKVKRVKVYTLTRLTFALDDSIERPYKENDATHLLGRNVENQA